MGLGPLERFLGHATIFTMPLVSFPLPGLSATAVAPLAMPLALLTCGVAIATRSRRTAVPTWLITGWIVLTALLLLSYAPLLIHGFEHVVDLGGRLIRTWLPFLAATTMVLTFALLTRSPTFGPERVLRGIVGSAAVYALVTIMALATAANVPIVSEAYIALREATTTSGRAPIGGLRRVAALAFEPSFAGFEYVGWWLPVAIAALLTPYRRLRRGAPWMLGVFLVGAIATRSLTAAVGLSALFTIGYVIGLMQIRTPINRALVALIVPALGASIFMLPQTASVVARLFTEATRIGSGDTLESGPNDASIAVRAALLHTGLRVGSSFPWTGAGFGIAGYQYASHRPTWTTVNRHMAEYERYLANPDGRVFPTPKNLYARIFSEAGALTLICFLTLLAAALRRAVILAVRPHSAAVIRTLATAAALGLVGSIMGYLSLDSFGIPFLWAWLGVAAGLPKP